MTFYDSTHTWHFVDRTAEPSRTGRWTKALCGSLFMPTRQVDSWKICKKCINHVPKGFPKYQREAVKEILLDLKSVSDIKTAKPKKLPKKLTERRFDPPEGLPA
jgi:hypothetical protein